jgi:putative Holliday junction resolvase
MRVIGLDVGERRIGVASGDTESLVAVPVGFVERVGTDADFDAVIEHATSRDAEAIVAGMPLTMRGTVGPQAESVERFIEELRSRTSLPVLTVDERLTTVEAERRIRETRNPGRGGRRRPEPKGSLDAAAAAIILQSYLDSQPTR